MPARSHNGFPAPDRDPDENIVPLEQGDDDALWMLLSTYADGEATTEEVLKVESLLRSHPVVAREYRFLQLTTDSVREFGEVEPPASMTGAIFAATARKKTLFQRLGTWWAQGGTAIGPTSLRVGGAVLASGLLAVVVWSRMSPVRPSGQAETPLTAYIQSPHNGSPLTTAPDVKVVAQTTHKEERSGQQSGVPVNMAAQTSITVDGQNWQVEPVVEKSVFSRPKVVMRPAQPVGTARRSASTAAAQSEPQPSGDIVTRAPNVEERHMAANNGADIRASKSDDLGPDFDTATEARPEVFANAMPQANSDEPPTTVVTASYRSIREMTRNTPPEVQSLYMRTQEAIRRQHEMQHYGGYGKDAYNNIQRREVGLSLVGGRF